MRQEVYRVAYDEATAELSEILSRFEQLRLRKDRIEKVVEALKPLISVSETQPAPERSVMPVERQVAAPEAQMAPPQPPAQNPPIPYPVQQAVDQGSDPFARRLESTVGSNAGSRDVREYSRLFNTSSSR